MDNEHEVAMGFTGGDVGVLRIEGMGFFARMAVTFVAEIVFGVFASIIAMWFSRQREYRADAGAGNLVGNHKMIAALQRLSTSQPSQLEGPSS